MKKWDILKNKETALIDPRFGALSQKGMKNGHVFPFDDKNRAITASRIPSFWGHLEVK